MDKRTGTEYVKNPAQCPFCGADDIEGGVDNSFEGDTMISGGCRCHACGERWAESFTLDGWLERVEDGPDIYHQDTRPQEIEQERDCLQEQVRILREALAGVLPYAISRAEDLDEAKQAGEEDSEHPGADAARRACENAEATLEATKEGA